MTEFQVSALHTASTDVDITLARVKHLTCPVETTTPWFSVSPTRYCPWCGKEVHIEDVEFVDGGEVWDFRDGGEE